MALLRRGADNPRAEYSFARPRAPNGGCYPSFQLCLEREGFLSYRACSTYVCTYVHTFLTSNRENRENRTETAPEIDTQNAGGHSGARNGRSDDLPERNPIIKHSFSSTRVPPRHFRKKMKAKPPGPFLREGLGCPPDHVRRSA